MVLSALIFIGLTCEVVRIKLDLGNLKTKILGEKCDSPPTRLWRVASWESSPSARKSLAVAS